MVWQPGPATLRCHRCGRGDTGCGRQGGQSGGGQGRQPGAPGQVAAGDGAREGVEAGACVQEPPKSGPSGAARHQGAGHCVQGKTEQDGGLSCGVELSNKLEEVVLLGLWSFKLL